MVGVRFVSGGVATRVVENVVSGARDSVGRLVVAVSFIVKRGMSLWPRSLRCRSKSKRRERYRKGGQIREGAVEEGRKLIEALMRLLNGAGISEIRWQWTRGSREARPVGHEERRFKNRQLRCNYELFSFVLGFVCRW